MAPSADISIRRITSDEGLLLRDLRLRSIAEAPHAFGQPLTEARRRPQAEWQRSASRSAHGDNRTWLIAQRQERSVGLVQGRRRRPGTLLLFSMWVDPSARRLGVGRMLVERLERWAATWGGTETILWVFAANLAALEFYRVLEFETIRDGSDADSGARFGALAMRRRILSPAPESASTAAC